MDIEKFLREIREKIINYRRDFHKYPESAWKEFRTSSLIGKYLREIGYEIKIGKEIISEEHRLDVPNELDLKKSYEKSLNQGAYKELSDYMIGGYTGVVGILQNGEGPTVALRFDIDGVKVLECENNEHFPFKNGFSSLNRGIMHACGHDGHIAIGLGVAEGIIRFKEYFNGTIKLIFQPGEESVCGGNPMAQSGILDDVDYLLSGHIGIKARKSGEIICGTKGFLATSKINAEFTGKSSHAAVAPEKGHNALLSASTAVLNLDAIPRNGEGITRINVGKLIAGSGRNVIPGKAFMEVETRGETTELNEYMESYATRILKASADMHDNHVKISCLGRSISGSSDRELIDIIKWEAKNINDYNNVIDEEDFGASKDICYMMKRVQKNGGKASYIMFGSELKDEHHSIRFDFNEEDLFPAINLYLRVVMNLCNKK
ncbi:M20 family metallo-hydrolase [Clostridium perfringens]|uniref:M20 family metallo-hydrolase n=1 Tax=Clostridium perfringens TaxID=1502 RepID=UPI0018DA3073|nr:M20 family metallo-hydrolase [Clostridium perfringens]MCR1964697.1 M20 family metallo-hydrolase [Clostridium perfringens]QPR51463.1 M20 family metallo-hydrolase [Clostridium perfringens]